MPITLLSREKAFQVVDAALRNAERTSSIV